MAYTDDEQGIPLLPANGHAEQVQRQVPNSLRPKTRLGWRAMGFLVAVCVGVFLVMTLWTSSSASTVDFEASANATVTRLLESQSRTLAQASARYTARTGRSPPQKFDKWYRFAKTNKCLIDEYDQIRRDFQPFHDLEKVSPGYFNKMLIKVLNFTTTENTDSGMKKYAVRDGQVRSTDETFAFYNDEWDRTFKSFAGGLPDMQFILNGRDDPRVVYDYHVPGAMNSALNVVDPHPFSRATDGHQVPTNCTVLGKPTGFANPNTDIAGYLQRLSGTDFTTDLYPIMSASRISPCISDVLMPSMFYYTFFHGYPHYRHPNTVPWSEKKSLAHWRGGNTGGLMTPETFRTFPRWKLVELGRKHRDLLDVGITQIEGAYCPTCDWDAIKAEFGISGQGEPREDQYDYKYLIDIDGNAFSGRFLGLLKTGSLVFKMTVFTEYFSDWIQPNVHYIPVLPDLSDLVEKVQWAKDHDEEARLIQATGKAFAERIMTDVQNDCYWFLALVEWGNLGRISG